MSVPRKWSGTTTMQPSAAAIMSAFARVLGAAKPKMSVPKMSAVVPAPTT